MMPSQVSITSFVLMPFFKAFSALIKGTSYRQSLFLTGLSSSHSCVSYSLRGRSERNSNRARISFEASTSSSAISVSIAQYRVAGPGLCMSSTSTFPASNLSNRARPAHTSAATVREYRPVGSGAPASAKASGGRKAVARVGLHELVLRDGRQDLEGQRRLRFLDPLAQAAERLRVGSEGLADEGQDLRPAVP